MALDSFRFEVFDEEEEGHDALLAVEQLGGGRGTLRLSRLLMANEALKTLILSLKLVRNWPSISSSVCSFRLIMSKSFYSYLD